MNDSLKFGLMLNLLLWCVISHAATLYFVRHAEKVTENIDDHNPPLSFQGQQQAAQLAYFLSHANIQVIYATSYKRAQQTAAVLAAQNNIKVKLYDPMQLQNFINTIKSTDHNTLVVGHSNTTPQAVSYLTQAPIKQLSEKDYGDVFQVIVNGDQVEFNHFKLSFQPNKTR